MRGQVLVEISDTGGVSASRLPTMPSLKEPPTLTGRVTWSSSLRQTVPALVADKQRICPKRFRFRSRPYEYGSDHQVDGS